MLRSSSLIFYVFTLPSSRHFCLKWCSISGSGYRTSGPRRLFSVLDKDVLCLRGKTVKPKSYEWNFFIGLWWNFAKFGEISGCEILRWCFSGDGKSFSLAPDLLIRSSALVVLKPQDPRFEQKYFLVDSLKHKVP